MEKSIKINLKDESFDIEIHGMGLDCIKNLSAISEDIAANLKSVLLLSGADPTAADNAINLLLQGNCDIQCILKECFSV